MNTQTILLVLAYVVLATSLVALVLYIINYVKNALAANDDCEDIDLYDHGYDDGTVDTINNIKENPHDILRVLANDFNYESLKITLFGLDNCYEYAKGLKDDVLKDMRNEEKYLYKRIVGACQVMQGEEYKGWSDKDKQLFREQVYGMMLYHNNLWARCCRFGVILKKD